jgi:hypothetical protein
MSALVLFAAGLSTTFLISIGVVRYLSSPLRKQLLELCGNADRAEFWTVFSNTTLALVPTVFAMQVDAAPESCVPSVLAVVGQVKWGIAGLVLSVLTLAWILSRFIRKHPVPPTPAPSFKSESWHL